MKKLSCLLLLTVCFSTVVWGQTVLASKFDSLIARLLPSGSEAGIAVYDLTERKPLYTYRDKHLAHPASTMKLLTTITALSQPDSDKPFRTELWYQGVIEHDTLQGDLYVVGGFDPEFGEKGMMALVDDIATLPCSVINGRVYGDVSMKDSLYFGNGWLWDDTPFAYQPYLSPLMYEKGVVTVTATPSTQQGAKARLTVKPASTYYTLSNQTQSRTSGAGKFIVTRDWLSDGNHITVAGNVQHTQRDAVNMRSSQDFFMYTLLDRLRSKGIAVTEGYAYTEFRKDSASVQVSSWETPVEEVVEKIMKESDNLNAEAMLYRMGAQATGRKYVSATDGIAEIIKLATQLGYQPDTYKIADGSGLSRYDYLSPALLLDFLVYAYSQTELFQKLYKALPIAGIDGTLKHRMKAGKAYKRVHAKTGSYTGINALAGYLKASNGHDIAFVIMNQNVLSPAKARAFQDAVCELLVD
ncbi:D-alanyl-D-alanine carboxypeptidase/D-alanyl-D-alanine endopeptidase [Bacteroides sp.]|uniref:D-alanyl-D-alanine carboxypeptidase/D-alanyl-D-alanine endopeptidase n=1 Tax=Bacteroides sp. TaxID=29523 RepID=UPI002FC75D3D